MEFLHRDERPAGLAPEEALPVILRVEGEHSQVLLTAAEIGACGDVPALIGTIRSRLD